MSFDNKTIYTRIQPQGYHKFLNNLKAVSDLIPNSNPESKRGSRHTAHITELLRGGKASLNFMIIRSTEESKLRVRKEPFFQNFMRFQEVGAAKTPKSSFGCNINSVETTNISSPPKPNISYSTLLSPLASRYCQLLPR